MNLTTAQLAQIQTFFTDKPVVKAWVFGSFARGTATENSDLDLLVELDYSRPIGLKYVEMMLDLQDLLHKKVDLVSEMSLSKYLKPRVDSEKQLIYVR